MAACGFWLSNSNFFHDFSKSFKTRLSILTTFPPFKADPTAWRTTKLQYHEDSADKLCYQ